MANSLYDSGRNSFLTGEIDYVNDTVKMALVATSYTSDVSGHVYYNDIDPASNVVGTAQTLLNKTAVAGVADCDDVEFGTIAAGSTIAYIVLYKDTGDNNTSPLIAVYDTAAGLPFTTSGSEITIKIDDGANKLFKL